MSRYAGIIKDDVANGKGIGLVLFTQGCLHRCKGCQNPETWALDGGMEFTQEVLDDILNYFRNNPLATRLTLSGGDPVLSPDVALLVAANVKNIRPDVKVWAYTGWLFEQIRENALLQYVDILVDGQFILERRDITLPFRGSDNQRIIDVQQSLLNDKIILWDCQ